MFWLYPNGVGAFHVNPPEGRELHHAEALVGVYDCDATLEQVKADILAIQSEGITP